MGKTRRQVRRERRMYWWFTPGRLNFVGVFMVAMPLMVYLDYGALARIGSAIALCATSSLAAYAYRHMRPSRFEAPALQELHASAPPTYIALSLSVIALTILRDPPPGGDLTYAVTYVFFGWFTGSLIAKTLGIWWLWLHGQSAFWVARHPFWLRWRRQKIPGSEEPEFFEERKSDRPVKS